MLTKGSLRLFVGLCLTLTAGSALGYGYEYLPGGRSRPSNETLGRVDTTLFGGTCYLIGTQTPIDCRLDFKVLGLANVYDKAPYVTVGVPHDQGQHAMPTDNGQRFDSTATQ